MINHSQHCVVMFEMVFPDQTGHYGTPFGGHTLRLMDKAAFVAALRYVRRMVVTACSERVGSKNATHQWKSYRADRLSHCDMAKRVICAEGNSCWLYLMKKENRHR